MAENGTITPNYAAIITAILYMSVYALTKKCLLLFDVSTNITKWK